jgi:hypothetical protein
MSGTFILIALVTIAHTAIWIRIYYNEEQGRKAQFAAMDEYLRTGEPIPGWDPRFYWSGNMRADDE